MTEFSDPVSHALATTRESGRSDPDAVLEILLGAGGRSTPLTAVEHLALAEALIELPLAGNKRALAFDLAGLHYVRIGDHLRAADSFTSALTTLDHLDPMWGELNHNLGSSLAELGDISTARRHWKIAVESFRRDRQYEKLVDSLYYLNESFIRSDDLTSAKELVEDNLTFLRKHGAQLPAILLATRFADSALELSGDKEFSDFYYKKALRWARSVSDPTAEVAPLASVALARLQTGPAGEAVRWARKAVAAADRSEDPTLRVRTRRLLSQTLARSGRLIDAEGPLDEAAHINGADREDAAGAAAELASVSAINSPSSEALSALNGRAEELEAVSGYQASLWVRRNQFHRLIEVADQDGAEEVALRVIDRIDDANLLDFVLLALQTFLDEGAFIHAADIVNASRDRLNLEGLARAASLLGKSRMNSIAMELWDRAMALPHSSLEEFRLRNDRAIALAELGEVDRAADEFQRCVDLASTDISLRFQSLWNLGETVRRTGRSNEAIEILKTAHALADSPIDRAHIQSLIALTFLDLDKNAQAKDLFQEVARASERGNDQALLASAWSGLGATYSKIGDLSSAVDAFQRAIEIRESLQDHKVVESLFGLIEVMTRLSPSDDLVSDLVGRFLSSLNNEPPGVAAWWTATTSAPLAEANYHDAAAAVLAYGALRALIVADDDEEPFVEVISAAVRTVVEHPEAKAPLRYYLDEWLEQRSHEVFELIEASAADLSAD